MADAKTALPDYPAAQGTATSLADPSGAGTQVPMGRGGNPPQGDIRGAGGLAQHYMTDGGIGVGAQAPLGWPKYEMPD